MTEQKYTLRRLTPATEIQSFDCNNQDLNNFLFDDAKNYLGELLAVTYLLETDIDTIAYFSVSNDSIRYEDAPSKSQFKKKILKPIPYEKRGLKTIPAVKIGRFAVNTSYQGKGVGSGLMNYIKWLFIDKNKTGCRYIIVDAVKNDKTIQFYRNNGFHLLEKKHSPDERTILMFFDLMEYVNSIDTQNTV